MLNFLGVHHNRIKSPWVLISHLSVRISIYGVYMKKNRFELSCLHFVLFLLHDFLGVITCNHWIRTSPKWLLKSDRGDRARLWWSDKYLITWFISSLLAQPEPFSIADAKIAIGETNKCRYQLSIPEKCIPKAVIVHLPVGGGLSKKETATQAKKRLNAR